LTMGWWKTPDPTGPTLLCKPSPATRSIWKRQGQDSEVSIKRLDVTQRCALRWYSSSSRRQNVDAASGGEVQIYLGDKSKRVAYPR